MALCGSKVPKDGTTGGNRKEQGDGIARPMSRASRFQSPTGDHKKGALLFAKCLKDGTPGGNRTHNGPLGGGCYIHLTTEAY